MRAGFLVKLLELLKAEITRHYFLPAKSYRAKMADELLKICSRCYTQYVLWTNTQIYILLFDTKIS
jgi:hypothetical protein